MPRVLHLYNILGARTERAWLNLALDLVRHGFTPTFGYEKIADESPRIDYEKVRLHRVNVEPVKEIDSQMDQLARSPDDPALQKLLGERFDLVHGHFGPRLLHAAPFVNCGVPTVISCYGYDASRLIRDPSWPARYRWAARHGAIFVAISRAMKQTLLDLDIGERSLRLIHLGIDPAAWPFRPQPAPALPRFLFVGRFTGKKAPLDLLLALSFLPGIRLDMVGSGPLENAIHTAIAQLKLSDRVILHGSIDAPAIRALMPAATALILPSVTAPDGDAEGTPVALMEAQAAGLPCITTLHAGCPEVLPPEAQCFVIPEHDPSALAGAMRRMIALSIADRSALQTAGRRWIEAHFDLRKMVADYAELYGRLAPGR